MISIFYQDIKTVQCIQFVVKYTAYMYSIMIKNTQFCNFLSVRKRPVKQFICHLFGRIVLNKLKN